MKVLLVFPFIIILLLGSCSELGGHASFTVEINEDASPCLKTLFPFEPSFRAARNRKDSAAIFFQTEGGTIQDVDLLFFEVFSRSDLSDVILKKNSGENTVAIGQIELGGSCPKLMHGYYLEGHLSFEEFNTQHNGRVKGKLREGVIKNSKTDMVVGRSLQGDFDFPVFGGQPFEEFTTN